MSKAHQNPRWTTLAMSAVAMMAAAPAVFEVNGSRNHNSMMHVLILTFDLLVQRLKEA